MMGAGAEQHNTRCALLGGGVEVIASCTTFALCMNTRVCTVCTGGIIITITYTPHSAAIRCDGVTADGNVCIDT